MTEVKADIKSNEVSKDDRPDLEKKIITCIAGPQRIPAVVVGVNRSVGITIVTVEDKDWFMVCMPGPIMPDFNDSIYEYDNDNWDEVFDFVVKGVESGVLVLDDVRSTFKHTNLRFASCTGEACAYRR